MGNCALINPCCVHRSAFLAVQARTQGCRTNDGQWVLEAILGKHPDLPRSTIVDVGLDFSSAHAPNLWTVTLCPRRVGHQKLPVNDTAVMGQYPAVQLGYPFTAVACRRLDLQLQRRDLISLSDLSFLLFCLCVSLSHSVGGSFSPHRGEIDLDIYRILSVLMSQ